jgi:hypothetical protein
MAMRAATMNPMSSIDTPPVVRESDSLERKLVLLALLISAAVLWIVIWFQYETFFPLLLSTFFADTALGLVAGLGARFVLRNRDWFVRYLVAILIAVIGMYMMGALTNWVLGIGPIRLEENFAEQMQEIKFDNNLGNQIRSLRLGSRVLFDFSKLDWADPVHLTVSLLMIVLSMQAWRRSVTPPAPEPVEVEVAPVPVVHPSPTRSRRGRRSAVSSSNTRARVRRTDHSSNHLTPNGHNAQSVHPQPRVRSNNGSRSTVRPEIKKIKEPVVKPKKKRQSRRKPKIQFAVVEEHRCPYCLDTVTRTDPRGVKECEVCHTLHHADCWAITGVCQVPHLNT